MTKWKATKGYSGYVVSNDGQVFSKKRKKLLTITESRNGYKCVTLTQDNKNYRLSIHRLVYETFVGVIPDGYEVNHKDENISNNKLDNLELLTHRENCNYGTRN